MVHKLCQSDYEAFKMPGVSGYDGGINNGNWVIFKDKWLFLDGIKIKLLLTITLIGR